MLSSDITGVSYLTTSMFSKVDDFWEVNEHSSEISMKMMREETEGGGEGVLCEYALLLDWMFLRALKW